jgi:hypothetical protein
MSVGESCFQAVCDAPDHAEAIQSLTDTHLSELIGHLARNLDENSITGALLGACLWESVRRLTANSDQS